MNEERIFELLNDYNFMDMLESYYAGDTGEFNFDYSYKCTEYQQDIRFSSNPIYDIASVALALAKDELETLRGYEVFANFTDEELVVLSAYVIARKIQHEENKHEALVQSEEWGSDSAKIERYGTKTRAVNKGYDQYMSNYSSSGYEILTMILELSEGKLK